MKLYLTPSDEKTIEELSKAVGKTTKTVVTRSRAVGKNPFEGRSQSVRTEEVSLLPEDEARRLPLDEIVVVVDAQMPVRAKRVVYYEDPFFKGIHRAQEGELPFPEPGDPRLPYSSPNEALAASSEPAVVLNAAGLESLWPEGFALRLVQDRADIDISGPEFDFVRSIRVFDVRFARQRESGRDGDCNRSAVVVLGTYRTQGEFSWQRSSIGALPEAHIGLERWGEYCPSIYHRSVFVDWQGYQGNYGFEQVIY